MSASKSPKVNKSTAKPIKKYASRHVGEVLQSLIDETLSKTKTNPKATAKWLSKLKLSIQRKVSKFSVVAYSSPADSADNLKTEIKRLKAQIGDKLKNIQQANLQSITSSNFSKPLVSDAASVPAGSYSNSTKNITEKFKNIAEQLSSSNRDASDRYSKFSTSLKTIQSNLPSVLSGLNNQKTNTLEEDVRYFTGFNNNSQSSSHGGKKASPLRTGNISNSGGVAASDGEDAVFDKLIEHLEGSN